MAFDAATFEIDPQSLTTPQARLEYMRDFLLRLPAERFDMNHPGTWDDADIGSCGAPACIGGWARALFRFTWERKGADPKARGPIGLSAVGVALFDLTAREAHRLFFPVMDLNYREVTPAQAAAVLDHLLNTGKVDWSVARKVEA